MSRFGRSLSVSGRFLARVVCRQTSGSGARSGLQRTPLFEGKKRSALVVGKPLAAFSENGNPDQAHVQPKHECQRDDRAANHRNRIIAQRD